jgi:hypothetical protein
MDELAATVEVIHGGALLGWASIALTESATRCARIASASLLRGKDPVTDGVCVLNPPD